MTNGERTFRATLRRVVPERLQPMIQETEGLAERFDAAGHALYLVGGTVRDAIAGRPGGSDLESSDVDVDLTTDANPDEIERLIEGWASTKWLQGKRFGTIGALRHGRRFEITTHRAE